MRCFIVLLIGLALAGCSNLSLSGVSSSVAAGGAALGTAVLTTNPVAIATTAVAAGVATDAVLAEPDVDLAELDPAVAKTKLFWDFVKEFIHWVIGGFVVLMVAMWLIPGPQHLLFWRKTDARTDSTDNRSRSTWRNS